MKNIQWRRAGFVVIAVFFQFSCVVTKMPEYKGERLNITYGQEEQSIQHYEKCKPLGKVAVFERTLAGASPFTLLYEEGLRRNADTAQLIYAENNLSRLYVRYWNCGTVAKPYGKRLGKDG
ncbi:MAG TPA: hypothetical protein PL135_13260 [Spirochaetota bacterium]|nr:hypothetical protein [Spirochaetota bacterium]